MSRSRNPSIIHAGSNELMPDHFYVTGDSDLERLHSMGFSDDEAERLIHMKDTVSEQPEYREIIAESRRLDFVRWLIEHDRMSR